MEAYSPSPRGIRDARNIMAVSIARGDEPQKVVEEMMKAIVVADDVSCSDPALYAMPSWAIGQIGDFVADIQERMNHMVEAAARMREGDA